MEWIIAHSNLLMGLALIMSEAAGAICQLVFPDNKGVAGIIAGIIKFLQNFQSSRDPLAISSKEDRKL